MPRYLIVNDQTYPGDPQARADSLGLPLVLGLPPMLVAPKNETEDYVLRDRTYARALLGQLLDEVEWFVVRVCGEGYAPAGQGIPYPPSVNLGALTAEEEEGEPVTGTLTQAKTSRGTITATFTTLAAGTRIILHAIDGMTFWQVRYTGAGWQVEQVVAGVVMQTGDLVADTSTGSLVVACTPLGVSITTPDGGYDMTEAAVGTSPLFGYILAGATALDGAVTFEPEFQIGYYLPGGLDEVPLIPECDDIAGAPPSTLPVSLFGGESSRLSAPSMPAAQPPSAVPSMGVSPDYAGMRRAGIKPNVQPPALSTHIHGREEDWRVSSFIPDPIVSNVNNFDPPGWAAQVIMFLSSDGPRTVTGLAVPADTSQAGPISDPWIPVRFVVNIGSDEITLAHEDTNSSPANRFAMSDETDLVLAPNAGVVLVYDYQTTARWHSTRAATSSLGGGGPITQNLTIMIDGDGNPIDPGVSGLLKLPTACTLTAWELVSVDGVEGSIVVELWADSYDNFPPDVADIVGASETPTLTAQVKNRNTNLNAGLGYALDAGDWLTWTVTSATDVTKVALSLTLVRSG